MLLAVVLFAYSRGIVSSRAIARACAEHVTFIALCGDTRPHVTTIAQFVSTLGADIAPIFAAVLAVCDRQGLIGREMFAIDGVKLPGNASKRRSGTRADVARQAAHPEDRRGATGSVRKSNRTDADSAKMATGKGVIRGYTGVAAVDARHQIIVDAQAHGTGSEHELLVPVVTATDPWRAPDTVVTADAGYHCEANLHHLATQGIPAVIADPALRERDARFATQARHRARPDPLHDKSPGAAATARRARAAPVFAPSDFTYDAAAVPQTRRICRSP
jgi:hypothetical protein